VHFPTPTLDKKHTCAVQPGTRTGKNGPGGMRGVKDKGMGVSFKNCIRQVSDRALRSVNRLSKSFYLTLSFEFIHRWSRDSNFISFLH